MDNSKTKININKIASINAYELIKQCQPQFKSSKELDMIFSSISNESFIIFSMNLNLKKY